MAGGRAQVAGVLASWPAGLGTCSVSLWQIRCNVNCLQNNTQYQKKKKGLHNSNPQASFTGAVTKFWFWSLLAEGSAEPSSSEGPADRLCGPDRLRGPDRLLRGLSPPFLLLPGEFPGVWELLLKETIALKRS